jgi:hypothetical protein
MNTSINHSSVQMKECDIENLESLIDLKFAVERQISIMHETFKKSNEYRSSNLDIYSIYNLYNNNIKESGQIFLETQTELIKKIDVILLKKCPHDWNHDAIDEPLSSRNICWCKKCYCRQY